MISPLEAEKKLSNFWLFMDLKPLFIACVIVYLSGTFIVCFGFLRQTSELPIWLSSVVDPFNYYVSNNTWAGMGIDRAVYNNTKSERDILKFICGFLFLNVAIYSLFAIIHASFYFLFIYEIILIYLKQNAKNVISAFLGYLLFSFVIFDSILVRNYMFNSDLVVSILYPLLLNFIIFYFIAISTSLFRRILVAHGQKQRDAKQS